MARTDVDGYGNLYASFAGCYELLMDSLGRDRAHVEQALLRECRPLPEVTEEMFFDSSDLREARETLDEFKRTFPISTTDIAVKYVDPQGEIMRCLDSTVIYPSQRQAPFVDFDLVVRTLKMSALFDAYMDRRVPESMRAPQPTWKDRLPKIEDIPPETMRAGGAMLNLAVELFSDFYQARASRRTRVVQISQAIKAAEAEV